MPLWNKRSSAVHTTLPSSGLAVDDVWISAYRPRVITNSNMRRGFRCQDPTRQDREPRLRGRPPSGSSQSSVNVEALVSDSGVRSQFPQRFDPRFRLLLTSLRLILCTSGFVPGPLLFSLCWIPTSTLMLFCRCSTSERTWPSARSPSTKSALRSSTSRCLSWRRGSV